VPPLIWIILGPVLLLGTLALLPLFFQIGQRPPDKEYRGFLYSNPDNPALFVPKRFGAGYTLSFGNPWSWAVLALIAAMVLLPSVLTVINVRRLPK
jgi:Family of unknown function (DUF5808)